MMLVMAVATTALCVVSLRVVRIDVVGRREQIEPGGFLTEQGVLGRMLQGGLGREEGLMRGRWDNRGDVGRDRGRR